MKKIYKKRFYEALKLLKTFCPVSLSYKPKINYIVSKMCGNCPKILGKFFENWFKAAYGEKSPKHG